MDDSFATTLDQELFSLVRAISENYRDGTLRFLEAHFPSFRAELDRAEERVGRLRNDLLAGAGALAEWRSALDELRGLWQLGTELRREREEGEAIDAAEEIELVGAEL
ncbi:MAG: hypothetical protein HYS14_01190 [Candidatus Rokubacteria bacterium]|nr:hypothetical protein [Candidatus Rokubacteria bacterium]